MLKKTVTYKNLFTEDEVTEELYFHLSKTEILELEVNTDGGLQGAMEKISKSQNNKDIWEIFKKFMLLSYGQRVGSEFVKSEEMRNRFESSQAFETFVFSLLESPTPEADMAEFFNGIVPQDMADEARRIAQAEETAPTKPELVPEPVAEPQTITPKALREMPQEEFDRAMRQINEGHLTLAE